MSTIIRVLSSVTSETLSDSQSVVSSESMLRQDIAMTQAKMFSRLIRFYCSPAEAALFLAICTFKVRREPRRHVSAGNLRLIVAAAS